jgi:phage tail protein X
MGDLLALIDTLARVHLVAKRAGCAVTAVYDAPPGLAELVAFVGLDSVLRVEPRRQPVQREERLGVEEERALDDPPV